MTRKTFAAALALFATFAPHAAAQTGRGVIDGLVTDTSLVSLGSVSVSILGSSVRTTTGDNGRFRIDGLRPGEYILLVRRLGYGGASSVIEVTDSDTLRVAIALKRVAVALDTVTALAPAMSPRMAEIQRRKAAGLGEIMMQAEIEKRNSVFVKDLLASFKSVSVSKGVALNRRSLPIKNCPFQFFIDEIAIPTPKLDQALPSPKEIAAIEVYANSASVPLQYKTISGGGYCGVILLWTRDGR